MKRCALGLVALLLVATATEARADEASGTRQAEELAGIRIAVERLVSLLETAEQHQRVELMLRRIELRERRLAPLEDRLRSVEQEVQGARDSLASLAKMRAQGEEQLDREIQDGTDAPGSDTRRMLDDVKRTVEVLDERLEAMTLRKQELEDRLADDREEIELLDEALAELLAEPGR